jgi:hypothetical protein
MAPHLKGRHRRAAEISPPARDVSPADAAAGFAALPRIFSRFLSG